MKQGEPDISFWLNFKSLLLQVTFLLPPAFTLHEVSGQLQEVPKLKTIIVDKTETCQSNPKHSYRIFIPSVEQGNNQLPLLVSIDPHGDGKLAVEGFKQAAQKYQAVVVASNLIKNNDPNYIRELEELIADIKSRYPVSNTLFIGGFSGGARMAIGYATNHPANGVLSCGALAQKEEINSISCRVFCLIGMEDFNFIEAAPFVINPKIMPSNLAIEITQATHNWPGKEQLSQAFSYLLLSVMPPGTWKNIRGFIAEQKQRIDTFKKAGKNLEAALIAWNMMSSPMFEMETSFEYVVGEITQGNGFKNQVAELDKNIQFEIKVRTVYLNALTQKDSVWWKPEIKSLNSKISEEKNEFTLQTYKRIKGFLGIACYSLSNRYTEIKDSQKLEQILAVYRMVEPNNTSIPQFYKTLGQMKKSGKK
jgi:hypothetical protein